MLARWIDWTTNTEWNLKPTEGLGSTFRTAREEQGRQHVFVGGPFPDLGGEGLDNFVSRCLFQQADERLDPRIERHDRGHRAVFARRGAGLEKEPTEPARAGAGTGAAEEISSRGFRGHRRVSRNWAAAAVFDWNTCQAFLLYSTRVPGEGHVWRVKVQEISEFCRGAWADERSPVPRHSLRYSACFS